MKNELVTIKNVRGFLDGDAAFLNTEDVSRGLGLTRVATSGNQVIRWERVRKYLEEFGVPTHGHGDNSQLIGKEGVPEYIPENIFYRLCFKAENETAQKFQSMVCEEILPAIRKHGVYANAETAERLMNDPDFMIKTFTALKKEREARLAAERNNQKMLPKAEFYDAVTGANCRSVVEMKVVAGVLNYQSVGRNKLFGILREEGILMQDNIPYRRYIDAGWFRLVESKYNDGNGDVCAYYKTVVYQKGIAGIKRILDRRGYTCKDRPMQKSII